MKQSALPLSLQVPSLNLSAGLISTMQERRTMLRHQSFYFPQQQGSHPLRFSHHAFPKAPTHAIKTACKADIPREKLDSLSEVSGVGMGQVQDRITRYHTALCEKISHESPVFLSQEPGLSSQSTMTWSTLVSPFRLTSSIGCFLRREDKPLPTKGKPLPPPERFIVELGSCRDHIEWILLQDHLLSVIMFSFPFFNTSKEMNVWSKYYLGEVEADTFC